MLEINDVSAPAALRLAAVDRIFDQGPLQNVKQYEYELHPKAFFRNKHRKLSRVY